MPLLRKSNDYVGLEKIDIYLEDTNDTSLFFRIFDVPEVLPAGKFAFRINGSSYLKVGSEIRVEVLDVDGNVIYTEYPQYLEGTSRLISIYVYPDTPYGIATVTIVGEAITIPGTAYTPRRSTSGVPSSWQGVMNVRWQKQILTDPNLRNDDRIRFYNTPIIYSQEKYTPYLNRTYITSSLPEDVNYTGSAYPNSGKVSGESVGSEYMITAKSGSSSFIRQMIGGQLTVTTPSRSSTIAYDQEYSTEIKNILNNKTLIAKSPYQVTTDLPASYIHLNRIADFDREVFKIPTETTRFVDSEFNIRYEVEPTYSATENYRSYAKVTVADMDTFSGDIYSTKLFMKSVGSGRDYELVGDDILETRELLLDSASVNIDERYGYFYGQYIIDGFWEQSLYNVEGSLTSSQLLHTRDKILDALYVSGTGISRGAKDYSIIKPIQTANYFASTEYTIGSKIHARIKLKNIENDDGSTVIGEKARLLIYMSGSAFNESLQTEQRFNGLGKLVQEIEIRNLQSGIKERNFGTIIQGFIADNSGIGTPLFVIDSGDWWISDIEIEAAQETGFSPGTTTFIIPINDWQRDDRLQFKAEFYNYRGIRAEVIATSSEQTFKGSNFYLQGTDNVLTGSMFIGNAIGQGIEMAGVNSAYLRNVGYRGYYSASDGSGPGGFMFWSGSVLTDINTLGGVPRYGGVGIEVHGNQIPPESDRRHAIRFRTDTGRLEITGSIYVTDGFFSGSIEANFIKVPLGGITGPETASAYYDISTGNYYRAAITQVGYAFFMSGSIGGWQIQGGRLISPNQNVILSGSGAIITPSFSVSENGIISASAGAIGGFGLSETTISSSNGELILRSNGQLTASNALLSGKIVAGTGSIGGWEITHDALSSDRIELNSANHFIQVSGSPTDYVKMYYTDTGNWGLQGVGGGSNVFHLGSSNSIGGWYFDSTQITASNLIIDSAGDIQTSNYVSGLAGWRISSISNGFAEFENVMIRGTLKTTVFEKESVNAVGGQLWIANSTTISGSSIGTTETTWSVANASSWAANEVVLVKKVNDTGFTTEYILIESSSRLDPASSVDFRGQLFVQRNYDGGLDWYFDQLKVPTGSNETLVNDSGSTSGIGYEPGQVIVSTGVSQSGYIKLNANPKDIYTPYMDIIERTGSGVYDVRLRVRLGDLSGLSPALLFGDVSPGHGLYTENVYLTGKITATSGAFTGKVHAGDLLIGSGIPQSAQYGGSSDQGIYIDEYNYWYDDGLFQIGNVDNSVKWDSSKLLISGALQANEGTIGGFHISETFISSSAGGLLILRGDTGQITASQADIEGKIVASSGEIGGFTIGSSSLYYADGTHIEESPNFFISGGAEVQGEPDIFKRALFISSSQFQVGANGAISSSAGYIGGWTINTQNLFGLATSEGGLNTKIILDPDDSSISFISRSLDGLSDFNLLKMSQSVINVALTYDDEGDVIDSRPLGIMRYTCDQPSYQISIGTGQFNFSFNDNSNDIPGHYQIYTYLREDGGTPNDLATGGRTNNFSAYQNNYGGDTLQTGLNYTGSNIHAGLYGMNARGAPGGIKAGVYGNCNDQGQSVGVLAEGRVKDNTDTVDSACSSWAFVARYRPSVFGNPWTGSYDSDLWSPTNNWGFINNLDDYHCGLIIYPPEFDPYTKSGGSSREYLKGRVGLGSWRPKAKLDVRGVVSASAFRTSVSMSFGVNPKDTTSPYIKYRATNNLDIYAGGNLGITVENTGDVGIGTVNPYVALHVRRAGGMTTPTKLTIHNQDTDDTQYSQLDFYNTSNNPSPTGNPTFGGYIRVTRDATASQRMTFGASNNGDIMDIIGYNTPTTGGSVGIGTTSWTGGHKLYVYGSIGASGAITPSTPSDIKYKKNISQLKDPTKKLIQIRGVEFDWVDDTPDGIPFEGHDVGLIADEVEKVLPEAVIEMGTDEKYKGIRYDRIVPLLIESIKEQAGRIDKLENELNELKKGK